MNIGYHYIWDIHGCDTTKISFEPDVKALLHALIAQLQLTKVKAAFKQFQPKGVTGFILLEESHISIHTWPEHQFAAIDLFSCKPIEASLLKPYLMEYFKASDIQFSSLKRGSVPTPYLKQSN